MTMEQDKSEFVVSKGPLEYGYIKLSVEHESKMSAPIEALQFKALITKALSELFGLVGAAMPLDVIKYNEHKKEGILRIHQKNVVKLWSSLSLFEFTCNNVSSIFRVHQVSSHLMALASDSRQMKLHLVDDD